MTYQPNKIFKTGDILTSEELNNMNTAIKDLDDNIINLTDNVTTVKDTVSKLPDTYYTKKIADETFVKKGETTSSGDGTSVDLSNYYTSAYIDANFSKKGEIPQIDLSDYYTKTSIDATFAKKSEIPQVDLSDYYTQQQVQDLITTTSKNCFLASTQTMTYTASEDTTQISLTTLASKDILAIIYKNLLLVQGVNYTFSNTTIALNFTLLKDETLYIVIGKTSYSYNDLTDKPVLGDGTFNTENYYSKSDVDALVAELRATIDELKATIDSQPVITAIHVENVSLNKHTLSLVEKATEQLVATLVPDNADNKNMTWSSSDTSKATVSDSGLVTAVAAGTANIIVTTEDGNKTDTCTITVTQVDESVHVTEFSIKPAKKFTLLTGNTRYLSVTTRPTNATDKTFTIQNSDTSVVTTTVAADNASLTVNALKAGTANLVLTTNDTVRKTYELEVTVQDSYGYTDNVLLYDAQQLLGVSPYFDSGFKCTFIASPLPQNITIHSIDCLKRKNVAGDFSFCVGTLEGSQFTVTKIFTFTAGAAGVWQNYALATPYVVTNANEYAFIYNKDNIITGVYDRDNVANMNRHVLSRSSTISWNQTFDTFDVGTVVEIPSNSPKYDGFTFSFNVRYTVNA